MRDCDGEISQARAPVLGKSGTFSRRAKPYNWPATSVNTGHLLTGLTDDHTALPTPTPLKTFGDYSRSLKVRTVTNLNRRRHTEGMTTSPLSRQDIEGEARTIVYSDLSKLSENSSKGCLKEKPRM